MKDTRRKAIEKAKDAQTFGLILGTLGRQGSNKVLNYFHVRITQNIILRSRFVSVINVNYTVQSI